MGIGKLLSRHQNSYGLQVLYEPSDPSSAVADVVFVHGLTGSWDTWTAKDSEKPWPETLLSLDVPDVRILAWAYDANITNFWDPVSNNRVANHAASLMGDLARRRARTDTEHRKIIFVAHSLGGLVVEEALFLSWNSPESDLPLIAHTTIAIAFLGTPHHGADVASWAEFGLRLTRLICRANSDIVNVLQPGSEMLASIQNRFHGNLRLRENQGKEIAITCFYEEHGFQGIGEGMTKFSSRDDNNYDRIVGELLRWVKPLRSPKARRSPSPMPQPHQTFQGYSPSNSPVALPYQSFQGPSQDRLAPPPFPPRQNSPGSSWRPQDDPMRLFLKQQQEQIYREAAKMLERQTEAHRNGTPEYLAYLPDDDPMLPVVKQQQEQIYRDAAKIVERQAEARRNGTPAYLAYFADGDPMKALFQQSYQQ
ncbi:MAG: hypothetical protein Q9163_005380 [Psora crenata]